MSAPTPPTDPNPSEFDHWAQPIDRLIIRTFFYRLAAPVLWLVGRFKR